MATLSSLSAIVPKKGISQHPPLQPSILPTISTAQASDDLDAAIQALPQELQDSILAYSFEVPVTVPISRAYKPPIALQLNRKHRARFAMHYYGTAVFESYLGVPLFIPHGQRRGVDAMPLWLSSLSGDHRKLMRLVRIKPLRGDANFTFSDRAVAFVFWSTLWPHHFEHCFDQLRLVVQHVSITGEEDRICTVSAMDAQRLKKRTDW